MSRFPRVPVFAPSGGKQRTVVSEAASRDINVIIDRWRRLGELPPSSGKAPEYGDFSDFGSFHECLQRVEQARDEFMELPSKVRAACDNDPGKFIDMVFDPEGRAKLEELGLVESKVPPGAPEPAPKAPETPPVAPGQHSA